jgi:glucose-6-phosphate dehydrogenase assembly protein OpcA
VSVGPGAASATAARRVDPARVERELAALWREAAEARAREASAPVHNRVLLHTLAVYATEPAAAEQARLVAASLSPRQPARTLILEALPDAAPAGLTATVALHHAPPRNGASPVCGELVTLTARGAEAVKLLPGAVLPLLLTNLPSFLWWTSGSPFGHPALAALSPALDRLIVDSLTFAAPAQDWAALDHAVSDPSFAPTVSDLAWARLAHWRYHTAQIFDAPAVLPALKQLQTVTVRHHAGSPVLAWLYAGWLASRLGWALAARESHAIRFAGGQQVQFESLPPQAELGSGSIAGVRLQAGDGAVFEVSRMGAACAVTHVDAAGRHSERVVSLRPELLSEWLGHELSRLAPVPTYEAALRLLAAQPAASAATPAE